jgi:hypothetical protein
MYNLRSFISDFKCYSDFKFQNLVHINKRSLELQRCSQIWERECWKLRECRVLREGERIPSLQPGGHDDHKLPTNRYLGHRNWYLSILLLERLTKRLHWVSTGDSSYRGTEAAVLPQDRIQRGILEGGGVPRNLLMLGGHSYLISLGAKSDNF